MGRSPEYYKTPVEGKTNRFVIKQSKEKLHRNFKKEIFLTSRKQRRRISVTRPIETPGNSLIACEGQVKSTFKSLLECRKVPCKLPRVESSFCSFVCS